MPQRTVTRTPQPRRGAARPTRRPARLVLWRRRLIALVVLVALVVGAGWGVVWLVGLVRGSFEAARAAEASQTPTGPSTAQPVACGPEALAWTLAQSGATAGGNVTFTLDVTNLSDASCLVDAGPSLVLSVVSGSDPIWSSADCGDGEEVRLLLGPGDSTQRTVTWGGTRSAPGCVSVESPVLPGTYQVATRYAGLDVPSAAAVFELH